MIKSIKVLPAFEEAKGPSGGKERGYDGFPVKAFPIGHKVNTDSPLVVLIGDNGSGKSTILEKIEAQFMGWGKNHWYFDVTCDEQGEPEWVQKSDLKYDDDNNYRNREIRSHGQYMLGELPGTLEEIGRTRSSGDIITIDEPENGISLRNRKKLVNIISNYALRNKMQIWVATHEPEFLKVPVARIINMDETPAGSYLASEFNLERYMVGKS